jgi:hypothetical protein
MANFLALLAFSGLIAAQFLAMVVAYQYRKGSPAPREPDLPGPHPHPPRRLTPRFAVLQAAGRFS